MIRALPSSEPQPLVVVSTARRVVGWRMAQDFEIALPDTVEERDAEFVVDAFSKDGEPLYRDVLVSHKDGTRTKERVRDMVKTIRKERVVIAHGGTVAGPKGAWLVSELVGAGDSTPPAWFVVGASREPYGGPWHIDERAVVTLAAWTAALEEAKAAQAAAEKAEADRIAAEKAEADAAVLVDAQKAKE
jgi:hypothetical protein